ncbi:glycosyltransferase family 2 protein [soil metagenome]
MGGKPKPRISLVVPVLNEAECLQAFYDRTSEAIRPLGDRYDFEFLFTDNHSDDGTFNLLRQLARRDPRIRAYRFSRNFGYQKSILTGYRLASGDAAIQLDCDLQDPPELIEAFLQKWREGYQVVYGVRRQRREGWSIQVARRAFYRLIDLLSEDRLPHDAGDFRLVDRRILDELAKIRDHDPYLRGTIAALGFNQIGIVYDRSERAGGQSKFRFRQLVRLAADGIFNHSIIPLRVATYVGLSISAASVLAIGGYLVARLYYGSGWPPGFATLAILILLSLGLMAMFLGIIGEYLGRIYQQLKLNPLTIIEDSINPAESAEAAPAITSTAA